MNLLVAAGVGGRGERTIAVTIYRIPGASAALLREAFRSVIARPTRTAWSARTIGPTTVSWVEGSEGAEPWCVAYWTRDDLVLHAAGHPADVEGVLRRTE